MTPGAPRPHLRPPSGWAAQYWAAVAAASRSGPGPSPASRCPGPRRPAPAAPRERRRGRAPARRRVISGVHDPEHRHDDIDRRVGRRQRYQIAHTPADHVARLPGATPGHRNSAGSKSTPAGVRSSGGGDQGGVPGAGGNIQHPIAGTDGCRPHRGVRHRLEPLRHARVITQVPGSWCLPRSLWACVIVVRRSGPEVRQARCAADPQFVQPRAPHAPARDRASGWGAYGLTGRPGAILGVPGTLTASLLVPSAASTPCESSAAAVTVITPAGSSVQAERDPTRRAYAVAAAAAYKKAAAETIREHPASTSTSTSSRRRASVARISPPRPRKEAAAAMLCGHRALAGIGPFGTLPAEGVMAAWESVYHQRPPKDLLEAAS